MDEQKLRRTNLNLAPLPIAYYFTHCRPNCRSYVEIYAKELKIVNTCQQTKLKCQAVSVVDVIVTNLR